MTIATSTPAAEAALQTMLTDVVNGLSQDRKTLPSKYFYDLEKYWEQDWQLPDRKSVV